MKKQTLKQGSKAKLSKQRPDGKNKNKDWYTTAAKNLAAKMTAKSLLGIVGWGIAGGPGTAAAVGAFQSVKDTVFSKLKKEK